MFAPTPTDAALAQIEHARAIAEGARARFAALGRRDGVAVCDRILTTCDHDAARVLRGEPLT